MFHNLLFQVLKFEFVFKLVRITVSIVVKIGCYWICFPMCILVILFIYFVLNFIPFWDVVSVKFPALTRLLEFMCTGFFSFEILSINLFSLIVGRVA